MSTLVSPESAFWKINYYYYIIIYLFLLFHEILSRVILQGNVLETSFSFVLDEIHMPFCVSVADHKKINWNKKFWDINDKCIQITVKWNGLNENAVATLFLCPKSRRHQNCILFSNFFCCKHIVCYLYLMVGLGSRMMLCL